MASLSPEEENYVRISLLLTGISPRALRKYFDDEFDPVCLQQSLKKNITKLEKLKMKNRINVMQWNLLFPRPPTVPDSRTFDISLMITLLRNLTSIINSDAEFDRLPHPIDISPGADLARIKYYRNYLAHLDDAHVKKTEFNNAWNNISGAICRLGGQDMKPRCDDLKTKTLDQTNAELMMEIKSSNNEIREMKESIENLKLSKDKITKKYELLEVELQDKMKMYAVIQKQCEELQKQCEHMAKDTEQLKTSQKDTVPWNIRDRINGKLEAWKDNDDKMFIKTKAAQFVLESLQEHNCVTITACSGVGKTATLRHVALQMANEYDVLIVTQPAEILNFYNPERKTLFVIDDLCGNFYVDKSDITNWEPVLKEIKPILQKDKTKILAACRLQVYQDKKFATLSVFKTFACNLLLENMRLSKTEKKSIAELYLGKEASAITELYDVYDCFPLLCQLYRESPRPNIKYFFENPFKVYEDDINELLERGNCTKYCALALCVIFNNELKGKLLTEDVKEETRIAIENTCEACKLVRGTSRLVLLDELESLKGTYIRQEEETYKIKHDKMFDFLAFHFAKNMITCLIINADAGLIKERFVLEKEDGMDEFITIIPTQHHSIYLQRMINDWGKGNLQDVFGNVNMKNNLFRQKFRSHLETMATSYQIHLANICEDQRIYPIGDDEDWVIFSVQTENEDGHNYVTIRRKFYNTVLINCCLLGDRSMVKWCFKHGVDINKCSDFGQSPLMVACEQGHKEVVTMLLDRGADYTICDRLGQSLVMQVCKQGFTDIFKNLLNGGVDFKSCDMEGQSPLILACEHGQTEIVNILLDKGVNWNERDRDDNTPIIKASEHGHSEIVSILLDKEVDCNNWTKYGQSPIVKACEHGHIGIVQMLLNRGMSCNDADSDGQSPLLMACENGHAEIVNILLDRGADCNNYKTLCDSPILAVCKNGHSKIAKMLLDKGIRITQDFGSRETHLTVACQRGHIEIVKLLLDRKASPNDDDLEAIMSFFKQPKKSDIMPPGFKTTDKRLQQPLKEASAHGHIEIAKILLDRLSKPTL